MVTMGTVGTVGVFVVVVGDMVTVSMVGVCSVVGSTASVYMRVLLGLEIAPKGSWGVGDGEDSTDGGGQLGDAGAGDTAALAQVVHQTAVQDGVDPHHQERKRRQHGVGLDVEPEHTRHVGGELSQQHVPASGE